MTYFTDLKFDLMIEFDWLEIWLNLINWKTVVVTVLESIGAG